MWKRCCIVGFWLFVLDSLKNINKAESPIHRFAKEVISSRKLLRVDTICIWCIWICIESTGFIIVVLRTLIFGLLVFILLPFISGLCIFALLEVFFSMVDWTLSDLFVQWLGVPILFGIYNSSKMHLHLALSNEIVLQPERR